LQQRRSFITWNKPDVNTVSKRDKDKTAKSFFILTVARKMEDANETHAGLPKKGKLETQDAKRQSTISLRRRSSLQT
jgi:hypothetical protein